MADNLGMKSGPRGRKRDSAEWSDESATPPQATGSKRTGPHHRGFQQHLIDHGVYPAKYENVLKGWKPPQPDNKDDILRVLAQRRPSLSESRFLDDDFERFERANARILGEWQVLYRVIPFIEGDSRFDNCDYGQIPFSNLDPLTDGTLVPGNPDLYYGNQPEALDIEIRTELSGHIIPSTKLDVPILPNFFLAVKGPDGSAAVAERQASYDGALGARGFRSLQVYSDTAVEYDNKAYTITSTYHQGTLKIYASHPIPSSGPGGGSEYATTLLKAYALVSDVDTFRAGATAFRNARDWAMQQRIEAINKANMKAKQYRSDPVPLIKDLSPPSPGGPNAYSDEEDDKKGNDEKCDGQSSPKRRRLSKSIDREESP